jgi:hypothetical protein
MILRIASSYGLPILIFIQASLQCLLIVHLRI